MILVFLSGERVTHEETAMVVDLVLIVVDRELAEDLVTWEVVEGNA